ncbi:hypothetical protein F4604DRAFT_1959635 [Suillus subluteus]|nr:hypothetical protein F4604DRAFT_1959635 [Suillus subluteus]
MCRNPTQPPIVPRPGRNSPTMHGNVLSFVTSVKCFLLARILFGLMSLVILWISLLLHLHLTTTSLPLRKPRLGAHWDMDPHENARPISAPTQPNLLLPLPPPSKHDYTTYQPGGPLVQVMHDCLLSTFLLLRANSMFDSVLSGLVNLFAAGTPSDDDYVPSAPLSPHPNSQRASTEVKNTAGQHGSGRLCGCF